MAYFTKRYHAPGTSPGTLQPAARLERVPLRILLVDYTDTEYDEREISSADECRVSLARDSITWIHVQTPDQRQGWIQATLLATPTSPPP